MNTQDTSNREFDGIVINLAEYSPAEFVQSVADLSQTNVAASTARYYELLCEAVAAEFPGAVVSTSRHPDYANTIDAPRSLADLEQRVYERLFNVGDDGLPSLLHQVGEEIQERGDFWIGVDPLRERGVYSFDLDGETRYVVVSEAAADGSRALHTPDEYAGGDDAESSIYPSGALDVQGDRWSGLRTEDMADTGFTATADEGRDTFSGQIGSRTVMGTDWPVIATITVCEPGQTDEGEPVAWWVNTVCNGAADGEGAGADTFAEALAYAQAAE